MGLFKKIFKPVAKVLDKVIPNEIKPALPYLAALAPVFAPAGMQGLLGSTMGRRALTSGLLNIGAQLSQEGSEGDINLLSAGLGALTGAMTTPGAAGDFRGMKFGTPAKAENIRGMEFLTGGLDQTGISTLERGANIGLEGLAKGSELLRPGGEMPALFSKAGAKAATLPAATATGDVMQAQARQLEKQAAIDAALAEAEALADSGARAAAIRNAMNAYGFFTDEEIEETIASAGYKAGGRVGFKFGGIDAAIKKVEDESIKESAKMVADMPDMDLMDLIEEFEIIFKRKPMNIEELKQFYRETYEMESPVRMKEKIKETVTVEAKDGGRIGFDNGGFEAFKYTSKIPEVFQEDAFGSDPLGQILKMSYAVRAPIIDVVRTVAKTAAEAAKLIAAITKLGYDITEPAREIIGDVAGGIYDVGKDLVKGSKTDTRFIQPMYYLQRFGGEKPLTDEETQLKMMKNSVGRDDPKKRRELENIVFGFDDAGMSQRPEDKEVSETIKFKEKYNFADGGLMDLGGKEMDLRGGGFVPIGKKERADDVPARLSKNEFVMTADAVRAAGGGSVNEGAKRMYKVMNDLEARA